MNKAIEEANTIPSLRSSIEFFLQDQKGSLPDENKIRDIFQKHASNERVCCKQAYMLLRDLDNSENLERDAVEKLARECAINEMSLSFEEFISMYKLWQIQNPTHPLSPNKRFLTQSRPYLRSGVLGKEQDVLFHIERLMNLKKRCESEGNYKKAQVLSRRLQEFKTFEAERRRKDMVNRHKKEIDMMEQTYINDQRMFEEQWDIKFNEFDKEFENNAEKIKRQHKEELLNFHTRRESKRPVRPQYSTELLNKRKIQGHLAKQGNYIKAHKVKYCADQLEEADMKATLAAFDIEYHLKEQKIISKHKLEIDALKQRSARIRAEMEIQKFEEFERRVQRFKNVFSELQNLQRLEMAYLENFIENQVIAGKRGALKMSLFRRKASINID